MFKTLVYLAFATIPIRINYVIYGNWQLTIALNIDVFAALRVVVCVEIALWTIIIYGYSIPYQKALADLFIILIV